MVRSGAGPEGGPIPPRLARRLLARIAAAMKPGGARRPACPRPPERTVPPTAPPDAGNPGSRDT